MDRKHRDGTLFAIAAYLIWGLFPVYWKQLSAVPALQLIGHRVVWSFALLAAILAITGKVRELLGALDRNAARTYAVAALLISVNWLVYVWAITHDFIVEASLGYFINPLFSVLLGVVLFREKLRPLQWIPIALAGAGVLYLTVTLGRVPWLALVLPVTFGLYGAVKKIAPLGSLVGLTVETAILFLPAATYLIFLEATGAGTFLHRPPIENVLMVGGGVITAAPLLLFASAATRVPLATMGLLQYLTPTMQFLIGVLLYKEPMPAARLIGFGLVWTALLLYWAEGALAGRQRRKARAQVPTVS
jgi:chloramphenicol-sensitive protein RarD